MREYHLGSVLSGGGSHPGRNKHATVDDWVALADAFYEASTDTSDGRQAIPILWGIEDWKELYENTLEQVKSG